MLIYSHMLLNRVGNRLYLQVMTHIKNLSTCINCTNLTADFQCTKHATEVEISSSCSDHTYQPALHKRSSCDNCGKHQTEACPNQTSAASGMLCFAWAS